MTAPDGESSRICWGLKLATKRSPWLLNASPLGPSSPWAALAKGADDAGRRHFDDRAVVVVGHIEVAGGVEGQAVGSVAGRGEGEGGGVVAGHQGVAAGVDRRAAGQEGHRLGRPAVVGQRPEQRVGREGAGQPAAPSLDQVVAAGEGAARVEATSPPEGLLATMELVSVAVPSVVDAAADGRPSCPTGWSWSPSPCRRCRCRRRCRPSCPTGWSWSASPCRRCRCRRRRCGRVARQGGVDQRRRAELLMPPPSRRSSCPTGWSWSESPCRRCRCRRRLRWPSCPTGWSWSASPCRVGMPPPELSAELSDRVELVSVAVPPGGCRCRRRVAGRVVRQGGVGQRRRAVWL